MNHDLTRTSLPHRHLTRVVATVIVLSLSIACDRQMTNAGQGMSPAIADGEPVTVSRSVLPIQRGDIVVFYYPKDTSKMFIKRVIGLPGEKIESDSGTIVVNGRTLDEPYLTNEGRSRDSWPPVEIPAGQYFVMGDYRSNSSDSRTWGTVAEKLIYGKVRR